MRVAVGSDHAGFDLKEILTAELAARGHEVADHGTYEPGASADYPDYGVAMAANKVPGIRAAVVHDVTTAALARRHNHANVVCLGARTTGATVAVEALAAFLAAPEEGGRHDIRIDKLAGFDRELVHLTLAHHTAVEGTP